MLRVNAFEKHVAARLLDFFNSKTPWQRSLWCSGTVLTLKETLQASQAVSAGVLSPSALQNVALQASVLIGKDRGMEDPDAKRVRQANLRAEDRGGLDYEGFSYRLVAQVTAGIERGYLCRWAEAVSTTDKLPSVERTARAVASHLLDAGFSSDFLHRWWTYRISYEPGIRTLSEILLEGQEMIAKPLANYEILIAFEHAPAPDPSAPPGNWLSNQQVSSWLRANGFDVSGIRQRGGLRFTLSSRDPLAAGELVAESVDRIISRVSLGSYRRLVPIDSIWIAGEKQPIRLRLRRRRVEVHALHRENRLFVGSEFGIVDAAVELVAPLDSESPGAAVAGGWAAIEALLAGPGDRDRVNAADRMASLVACSFPRAELTALSYRLEEQGGDTADRLRMCESNKERSALVAGLAMGGPTPTFGSDSDTAAFARMTTLLKEPRRRLRDVEAHLSYCLRRLYRHRNMVLHWGRTDAVGLRACLRTAAPVVGAGLDRIAHAWFVEKCHPLELAARARIRLDTLASSGRSPVDLLEQPAAPAP
jgi:hypothetical protein